MEKRPRIPIKLEFIDYLFEVAGAIGLACLIIIPIYFYNDLPDQIPKHFNIHGEVDAYGSSEGIWTLLLIGIIIYVGLTIINKYPHIFNYPTKVTAENAKRLYLLGTRTIRLLKALFLFLFVFLEYMTIQIALSNVTGLGEYSLLISLGFIGIVIMVMIFKMTRN